MAFSLLIILIEESVSRVPILPHRNAKKRSFLLCLSGVKGANIITKNVQNKVSGMNVRQKYMKKSLPPIELRMLMYLDAQKRVLMSNSLYLASRIIFIFQLSWSILKYVVFTHSITIISAPFLFKHVMQSRVKA